MMLARATATSRATPASSVRPCPPRSSLLRAPRVSVHEVVTGLAAAGDVDAPIGVVVGGAIVVTLIATAIVPLALKPGQDAADKIFAAKQKAPLDKAPPKAKGRR